MKIKIKPADRWLSLCIRVQYEWTCQRCGTQYKPGHQGLHAAHIFSRRHSATRWVPSNLIALCFGCHRVFDEDAQFHVDFAREHIGPTMYEQLNEWRNQVVKIPKGEQKRIGEYYRDVAATLQRGEMVTIAPSLLRYLK